jgi:energy-coupling factor transporter ATP-binding protein EcfA2
MFDDFNICPYTGLRPFTEEESIYFKGRDEHIDQATMQLGNNKFLILTGASGDGKSSLVYAGIIPNAKAGFLKSNFTNWSIADFRPERSPLLNFSKSIADQLGISNVSTVLSELNHGYSSLVDLYKASDLYLDPNDPEWINGDEAQRKSMERKAANLMIVADQFEEFFTNPENYSNGVPSREANLVTNLLLETARIALDENLPIYVIITMRSDFIGQCASFRGLPEYIGFSQFFVPRLNRKQLQEVIEEPAVLSGNRISRRLTERLILDITEGTDQLPILQHALNQVWKMADNGNDEMDLIHYAMVGGMEGKELPDDSFMKYKQWFNEQSQKIRDCYDQPGLQNVLNTHANKLFNLCYDSLDDVNKNSLTEVEAKMIIKTAFKCLTKIDDGRAVRNRMTLGEITSIINLENVDDQKVATVLGIYRETGNTLLRPYIEEDDKLEENSVLDITHESLIRNWDYLGHWAKEEYDNYTTFLDFAQQLNRWVQSGKSNSFLLYIGPLTFFENWFNKAKPNVSWIARYLDDEKTDEKYKKSEVTLNNANEFLKRSARKHIVTRTVMRYGARRIAATLALIAFIVFSSFMVKNYLERQNASVLKSIKAETLSLASNPKVVHQEKITLLVESIKGKHLTLSEIVNSIESPLEQVRITNGIIAMVLLQGKYEPADLILEGIHQNDSIFDSLRDKVKDDSDLDKLFNEIFNFRGVLEIAHYYRPEERIEKYILNHAERSAFWVNYVIDQEPVNFTSFTQFNLALEYALNHRKLSGGQIDDLVGFLSPFENDNRSDWIENTYQADKLLIRGSQSYGFKFNGLYHILAHLYAARGNTNRVLSCMDSLILYNDNYYGNVYESSPDNATNIAATYYLNGHEKEMHAFVDGYCQKASRTTIDFYRELLGNSIPNVYLLSNLDLYDFALTYGNLNLQGSGKEQKSFFYEVFRQEVSKHAGSNNEKNFLLALSYKNQGIVEMMQIQASGQEVKKDIKDSYFKRALDLYSMVDDSYLNKNIDISITGSQDFNTSRKFLFLYPDIRLEKQPLEPRAYYFYYYSGVFIDYIIEERLFDTLYKTEEEIQYFDTWFREYNKIMFQPNYFMRDPIKNSTLVSIERELADRQAAEISDINLLYMYLGIEMANRDNPDSLLYCYNQLKKNNFNNLFNYRAFNNQINIHSFRLLAQLAAELARYGKMEESFELVNALNNPVNRSSIYAFVAKELSYYNFSAETIRIFIDSSYAEIDKIENLTTGQPNRTMLSYALALQNNKQDLDKAYRVIKNVPFKFVGYERMARSVAYHQHMFDAYESIPDNISDTDITVFLWNIMYGYSLSAGQVDENWKIYNENYPWWLTRLIIYNNDIG